MERPRGSLRGEGGDPPVAAGGRRKAVGYAPKLKELNRDWAIVSRVVIHPKYRTIGLGARLVRETLPLVGRRHVELIAVMAQYNPFAEHAGMRRVQVNEPHRSVPRAIERLHGLAFNPVMMASKAYNRRQLQELTDIQVDQVREALLGVSTHYSKRLMSTGHPYVRKAEMREWVAAQPRERFARSLAILSILSETKVYLYWSRDWMEDGFSITREEWEAKRDG